MLALEYRPYSHLGSTERGSQWESDHFVRHGWDYLIGSSGFGCKDLVVRP